jgi:hypothetical protein
VYAVAAVKKVFKCRIFAANKQRFRRKIGFEQWQNTSTNRKTGRVLHGMTEP